MREILAELDRWQREGEEIAVATLVRAHGPAPRLPGARFCATRSGRMAGSVSGGCVENDVFHHVLEVLAGGEPVVARYGIDDETALAVGLSCGGSIDVLIEPFAAGEAWDAARREVDAARPAALGTALSPRELVGRKLGVLEGGSTAGGIDPELDARVAEEARRLLPAGGTRVLSLPWRGAEASVFVETFTPPLHLYIVGATHLGMSLCRIAKELGLRVTVIDPRSALLARERFPEADAIVEAWPGEALVDEPLDASSCVVTLTHDMKLDIPALALALRSSAGYIGALGSRGTHARRVARLREEGFGDAELARIHAPVGLDLGGRSPAEIALAIAAEILAVRHARDAPSLRDTRGIGGVRS